MCSQTQKISLRFFAVIYLILVQYVQYNTGGAATDLPYNLTTVLGLIIFILWGLYITAEKKIVFISNFNLFNILFLLLIFIPLAYSNSNLKFFEGHYFFTIAMVICSLIVLDQITTSDTFRVKLLFIVLVSANLSAILATLQYFSFFPFDYATKYARPSGNFGQVNLLASYLSAGLSCAFYIVHQKSRLLRKKSYKLILFASSIFLPCITIMTLSRIGWISVLIILLVNSILYFRKPSEIFKWMLIGSIISTLLSSYILSTQSSAQSTIKHKLEAVGQRGQIYSLSLELLQENLLNGTGYGQFEKSIFEKSQSTERYQGTHSLTHPHNEILFIAIQGGIVAIMGLLLLIALFVKGILYCSFSTFLSNFALLIPLIIHSQLELPLFASTPHLFTLFFLLYIVYPKTQKIRLKNYPGPYLFKPVSIAFGATALIFYISGLHTLRLAYLYSSTHQNFDVYTQLVNPFIHQEKYQNNLARNKLLNSLPTNDDVKNELVEYYRNKMEKQPRPANLNNLCLTYLKFNQMKKANEVLAELKEYFPLYNEKENKKGCGAMLNKK